MAGQDGGDAVRLDGCWVLVLAQLDILKHDGMQTSILKLWSLVHEARERIVGYDLRCGRGAACWVLPQ